ncbi:MAG: hypothetical protein AAGI72_07170 [Pseudomonadota bacterium]
MYIDIAIRTHRFVLLPDGSDSNGLRAPIFLRFLLASLAISFIVIAIGFIGSRISIVVDGIYTLCLILTAVVVLYVVARLSLVLPNRALGEATRYSEVWSWSQGIGWRLAGAIYLPIVCLGIVSGLLTQAVPPGLALVATTLVGLPTTVFGIILLSVAYRDIAARSARQTP